MTSLSLDLSSLKMEVPIQTAYPSPVSTSPSPLMLDQSDFACPSDAADSRSHYQDAYASLDYYVERIQYAPLPKDTIPADRNPHCQCHECRSSSSPSPSLSAYGCWDELPNCGEAMSLDDIPPPTGWADSLSSSSTFFTGHSMDDTSSMDTDLDRDDFLSPSLSDYDYCDDEPPYCPPLFDEPLRFVQIDYKRGEDGKYQPVYSLGDCGARLAKFED